MEQYDVVVIGGGPGGYPAALRAAQHGLSVALVEERYLGGECTNYACIPTKALLSITKKNIGIKPSEAYEFTKSVVGRVRSGIKLLLKKRGVAIHKGRAKIESTNIVSIDGEVRVKCSKGIIIATGTSPISIPGINVDGEYIHNNRTIIDALRERSSSINSILVVGGGPAGLEYAEIFSRLGAEVIVVEILDRILPMMDREASSIVSRYLKKLGVRIYTSTSIKSVERINGKIRTRIGGERVKEVDMILLSVGRRPNTSNLGLESVGVRLDEKGYIITNSRLQTSVPSIYAVGDVTGQPLLAHKAIHQGLIAADNLAGRSRLYRNDIVPSVVYTGIEVAQVGFSLSSAREKGYDAREAKIRLGAVPLAVVEGVEYGLVKIIYDASTKRVLGATLVMPHASELISLISLAILKHLTLRELSEVIYQHPTFSEAIGEASLVGLGEPLHYIR